MEILLQVARPREAVEVDFTRKTLYFLAAVAGVTFSDDTCPSNQEIMHYKAAIPFINMGSMLQQDLAQLPIFHDFNEAQIEQLQPLLEYSPFAPDQVIFEQNQIADYLYILLTGEVLVRYKPDDGPILTVAKIGFGGVFGWSAALGRRVYTSSAITVKDCEMYRIHGKQLRQFCEEHPETGAILLERLADVIAQRLHNTHPHILNILSRGVDLPEKFR
jgi:CRP-like cAMP-binding protein